ncbi:MAG: thiamine pyrophosphate-binding protein [Dehalococcoidia bacterium]|nr:MAG: thiamine pyrophosphate-binding protein [Chloroflexota bacterium]
MKMTGKKALMECIKAEGITNVYGNPGTSEGPIMEEIVRHKELRYLLTLQEGVATGMAEADARVNNKASFLSLHIDSGLVNGFSLMNDAYTTGTPMVVTSATYDVRNLRNRDLVELAKPFTKWSTQVVLPDQVPSVMRKAFTEANTHPKGPVFVGFSSNALDGEADMEIYPSSIPVYGGLDDHAIKEISTSIENSSYPVLLVGDRVAEDSALKEAVELAEKIGMMVFIEGSNIPFPTNHPQMVGYHSIRSDKQRSLLDDSDLIISAGADLFSDWFYEGDVLISDKTEFIFLDSKPNSQGNRQPSKITGLGNLKVIFKQLLETINYSKIENVKNRIDEISKIKKEIDDNTKKAAEKNWNNSLMSPERAMYELGNSLPKDTILVNDAISHRAAVMEYIKFESSDQMISGRGGSIGWGVGATLGVQCAAPDKNVVGIIGDGSAMMTVQGYWTAANDNIPCIFIILNNQSYRILKVNIDYYRKKIREEVETSGDYPYMDFPMVLNHTEIAKSMGVDAVRITDPSEINTEITKAINSKKPRLIELMIDGNL